MSDNREHTRFELMLELEALARDQETLNPRDADEHERLLQRLDRLRRKVTSHLDEQHRDR